MPNVHDRKLSRRELSRRMSRLDATAAGDPGDGAERGVRVLEFRTGTGLDFDVMVGRYMDVGAVRYRRAAIGWQSPTGFRSPWLHDPEGGRGPGLAFLIKYDQYSHEPILKSPFGVIDHPGIMATH